MKAEMDLVLYHALSSSYSQKVVLALHEKNLKFDSRLISLPTNENLEPWFLKLNRKGLVPVLQHQQKIVCESADIIDYLEATFCGDGVPKLIPVDQTLAKKMQEFRIQLDSISVPTITFGRVFFPQLVKDSQMSETEVTLRRQACSTRPASLEQYIAKYPELQDVYQAKQEVFKDVLVSFQKLETVEQELQKMEKVFDSVEVELALHTEDQEDCWLVCSHFTVADITLTLLLRRCEFLGYWHRFFDEGRRPFLVKYYERVQKRKSFTATFHPSIRGDV